MRRRGQRDLNPVIIGLLVLLLVYLFLPKEYKDKLKNFIKKKENKLKN